MNNFLVAVRRGTGSVERCPEPVDIFAVISMLGRLKPYQQLEVSVVAAYARPEGAS